MNDFSELAESQRWVLWAMEWLRWQREDHPAWNKPHGFRLTGSTPFPIHFSARDAAWHGDKCFCHRDRFGHNSIGKVDTSPVNANGNWGQAAHVGETGEAGWAWPGTGAASCGPCTAGAEGVCGFAARVVSSLQGHGASKRVGVSAWESEALLLDFCRAVYWGALPTWISTPESDARSEGLSPDQRCDVSPPQTAAPQCRRGSASQQLACKGVSLKDTSPLPAVTRCLHPVIATSGAPHEAFGLAINPW